jgi:two-component system invasion response regulator UvrY
MRILLADKRPRTRFALRALLRHRPGFEVVSEAEDVQGLLVQVETTSPDLVVLDWNLHGQAEADLLPALRRACPGLAVIVISARQEVEQAALTAGADAFVSKTDPPDQLLQAIKGCGQRDP